MNNFTKQYVIKPGAIKVAIKVPKTCLKNDNSPFVDGYDIFSEAKKLGDKINHEIGNDDFEFDRLQCFLAHKVELEKYIMETRNTKKIPVWGDYHVFPTEQAIFDSMPNLKSSETDKIYLHTRHAFRLWEGGTSQNKFFAPGLRHALNWVNQLASQALHCNPYAEACLLTMEADIQNGENYFAIYRTSAETQLAEMEKNGLKLSKFSNPNPMEINVGHVRHYGFKLLKLLTDYDTFVCLVLTLQSKGLITKKEERDVLNRGATHIRRVVNNVYLDNKKCGHMKGLTRALLEDDQTANSFIGFIENAVLRPIPMDVITFKTRPSLLRIKTDMTPEQAGALAKRLYKLGVCDK